MTNPTRADQGTTLSPALAALAPVSGKRRPARVVEHPAFRAARARLDQPYAELRLPVVALNRPAAERALPCPGRATPLDSRPMEAA